MHDDRLPLFCDRCSLELQPGKGNFYVVKILAVADPTSPVIDTDEIPEDIGLEIERLLEQIETMTEQELVDQVYRRVVLYLCGPCYRVWIENPVPR